MPRYDKASIQLDAAANTGADNELDRYHAFSC